MAKILILSDGYNTPTGFGGQATMFADAMKEAGHDVYYIGLGQGPIEKTANGITKLPAGDLKFGEAMLNEYIKKYKPDILWTLLDIWMTAYIAEGGVGMEDGTILPCDLKNTKWISYFPIDSDDKLTPSYVNLLQKMPYPVVFSEAALRVIQRDCGFTPSYIPHCIDTSKFRPLEDADKKKLVSNQQANAKDCFIIGMNGNNQLRKFQPYLLEAYKKFMKKDTRLALHMDLLKSRGLWEANGWNLAMIAQNLGIPANHLIKTPAARGFSGKFEITPKEINAFYNLCSVHYHCGNEGFGVPSMESMAAGVPQLAVDHTTAREFVGNNERGRLVKVGNWWYHQDSGIRWAMPDVDDLAAQMEYLYTHREELKLMSEKSVKFAAAYDVKKIMPVWVGFIDKILKDEAPAPNYQQGILGV